MARLKKGETFRQYAGQEDLVGATCTESRYNEFFFEKDGRKFILEGEEEWPTTCMCYDGCTCTPSFNLRVWEEKIVE